MSNMCCPVLSHGRSFIHRHPKWSHTAGWNDFAAGTFSNAGPLYRLPFPRLTWMLRSAPPLGSWQKAFFVHVLNRTIHACLKPNGTDFFMNRSFPQKNIYYKNLVTDRVSSTNSSEVDVSNQSMFLQHAPSLWNFFWVVCSYLFCILEITPLIAFIKSFSCEIKRLVIFSTGNQLTSIIQAKIEEPSHYLVT